jgi:hypothetical protein
MSYIEESNGSFEERGEGEIESKRLRSTRDVNDRIKHENCMDLFLVEGGMCFYDNKTDKDKEVPLRYKNYVKN